MTGKRRDMGLGVYPEVGIADARIRGMAARQSIASGKDSIDEREADRAALRARPHVFNVGIREGAQDAGQVAQP